MCSTNVPRRLHRIVLLLLTFAAISLAHTALGQQDQGRIGGLVKDANGGLVQGAAIVVKNERTAEERTATSTDSGSYIVSGLRPSVYSITASAQNFNVRATSVQLLAGQELNLDLTLQTTGVEAKVDIVAAPDTGIDTGTAAMGVKSPGNLNGEVPSPFRLLSSLENVQEFRVDSNNFPAEFGTGTGGQVSVVTKSGSNAFHGSVFEYIRNNALDAANFFDNIIGQKAPLRLNQFGGSFGGPIVWFHAVAGGRRVWTLATDCGTHGRAGNEPPDPVCVEIELLSLSNIPQPRSTQGKSICHYKK